MYPFTLAMIKTAVLIATLCLAISYAKKEVTLLLKKGINLPSEPPFDKTVVQGLPDDASLLTALQTAQNGGKLT